MNQFKCSLIIHGAGIVKGTRFGLSIFNLNVFFCCNPITDKYLVDLTAKTT